MSDNTIKLIKCERCYGTGHADLGLCSYCRGSGHVPAPVPSDIDGPAGEADDLIERKVWRRVRDDGRVTFWETEVPDGELFVPAARLAALQQERDSWKSRSDEAQRWSLDHHAKWKVVEVFVASLQMRVEELTEALDQLLDDMGEDGLSVCQAAKEMAIAALAKTVEPHQ